MAITYPISMPNDRRLAEVRFTPRSVVGVSRSPFTRQPKAHVWDGQIWEADITLPPLKSSEARDWESFMIKLNGQEGTFLFGDPRSTGPSGTISGTIRIDGSAQVGNSLVIDGATTGQTLLAGDWFQLSTGSSARLYRNLTDATANGSGELTLDIWPSIRTAYADNTIVTLSSPKGVFRMVSNEMPFNFSPSGFSEMTFGAVSEPVS